MNDNDRATTPELNSSDTGKNQQKKKSTNGDSDTSFQIPDRVFAPFTYILSSSSDDDDDLLSGNPTKPIARNTTKNNNHNKNTEQDDSDSNSLKTQDETTYHNLEAEYHARDKHPSTREIKKKNATVTTVKKNNSVRKKAPKSITDSSEDKNDRQTKPRAKTSAKSNPKLAPKNNNVPKKPPPKSRKRTTDQLDHNDDNSDSDWEDDDDDRQKKPRAKTSAKNPASVPPPTKNNDKRRPLARTKKTAKKSIRSSATTSSSSTNQTRPLAAKRNTTGMSNQDGSSSIDDDDDDDWQTKPPPKRKKPPPPVAKRKKIATKSTLLKEPPSYSKRTTSNDAAASSSSGRESSSATDNVARLPLHSITATGPTTPVATSSSNQVYSGGVLSAKKTRDLDHYMKEKMDEWTNRLPPEKKAQYSKVISDEVRRKIALAVPTSQNELKADKVLLDKAMRKKYGPQILQVVQKFLQSNDGKLSQYVKRKRKERRVQEKRKDGGKKGSRRQSNSTTGNQSSTSIIEISDSSSSSDDDDDDTTRTNGAAAIDENTISTVSESASSSKVTRKPLPSNEPFSNSGNKSSEKQKAKEVSKKTPAKGKKRTREERGSVPNPPAASKASSSSSSEFNPFSSDSDNSNSGEQQSKKAAIPTKTTKRAREDRDSGSSDEETSKATPPPIPRRGKKRARKEGDEKDDNNGKKKSPSLIQPPRRTTKNTSTKETSRPIKAPVRGRSRTSSVHAKSIVRDNRTVATKTLDQRGKRNLEKEARSYDSSSDSSSDDSILAPDKSTNKKHQDAHQGILDAEKTKALDDCIVKKFQQRAAIEREMMGNDDCQHWTIPEDTRKKITLLVPTSEKHLMTHKIFSDAERRLYGTFLVRQIKEFLTNEGISVDEIERTRQAKADEIAQIQSEVLASMKRKKRKSSCESDGWDLNQLLLGHGYCSEWLDKDGQKLCVYGTVIEYHPSHSDDDEIDDTGDLVSIHYPEHSRSLLKQHHTPFKNLFINQFHPMNVCHAWGGCLLYQEKQDKMHVMDAFEKRIPFPSEVNRARVPILWRVPDLYTTETMFQKSAENMPSLCLHYGGFQLEFTVKPSTIPNSGNGVFLSITSLLNIQRRNVPVFSLQSGEVLDIGVYAPLAAEDETPNHIMMVRSVLQSFWCDSYSMNTRNKHSVFDITHGCGKLTREAKESVLPFVNESDEWETHQSEIHMVVDPQGSYHYALGYMQDEDVSGIDREVPLFQQLADGKPREIFVDYGIDYELNRLRHGYPREPLTTAEQKQTLDVDEQEKLDCIWDYSEQKVKDGVQCVYDFVRNGTMERVQKLLEDDDRNDIRERVLAVVILFHVRSEQLRPGGVNSLRASTTGEPDARKQSPRMNLRQRKQNVCYSDDANDDGADSIKLTRKDWENMDDQLQAVVDKLLPDSSPSTMLSTLSKTADRDSILGMACAIVAPELGHSDDDAEVNCYAGI